MKIRRCCVYVRLSVSSEESVSIARQVDAAEKYAAARGWEVVGVFKDDGVSATKNKPEDRAGWQALVASPEKFQAVVVWKVDRLARRVLDFLHADEALQARGAGLVAVEDPVDMTTPQGRAFATVLAVFGELEAATIRARVKAARNHLLSNGRWPGGRVPYGWRIADNPDGPGRVVVQDPETVAVVRSMVDRTLAGHSVHSTTRWLTEQGVPTYTGGDKWAYNTVWGILHHPLLAGLIPHNPGNTDRARGDGVVLGDNGLPLVHEALAVMEVGAWRAMVKRLDDPTVDPRRMPRAMRRTTSGVLSGLIFCGEHDEPQRMWRGTKKTVKGTSYACPECHQTLSNVDDLVVAAFLEARGDVFHLDVMEEVVEGAAAEYAEATVRLTELSGRLALAEGDEFQGLLAEIGKVKAVQAVAAEQPSTRVWRQVSGPTRTFAKDWEAAEDDERRRVVLGHALRRVVVTRGRRGEWTAAAKMARMTFDWVDAGQVDAPERASLS